MKRLILIAVLGIPYLTSGQSFYNLRLPRNVTVFGGMGSSQYFGDLYTGNIRGNRYGFNAGTEFFFHHRYSLRGELNVFRLYGSDRLAPAVDADEQGARNLSFWSNSKELSLAGTVNLLPLPNRFDQRPYINIYGFAGVGLLYMNPKTRYQGDIVALQPLRTEGVKYSRLQPTFPLGVGLRIKFRMIYSIVFEAGYRYTMTDYLDDVSGVPDSNVPTKGRYPNPATLSSNLSRALSDRRQEKDPSSSFPYTFGVRGNPQTKDSYFLFNVKIEYYLKEVFDPFDRGRNKLLYIRKNRR